MFSIRKAERRQAKLRLALIGVSGCGKSLGAINIASGMNQKFVVIDTEQKSADLYANVADFDVLTLDKPFTPDRYIEAIKQCERAGYETIIIDSLSHAWSGEGGVLDIQDTVIQASRTKNSYTAWKEVTPLHNKLVNAILHSTSHIIVTMRVKTHYEVVSENGKAKPIKIGLSPVQREGMDYEFTTVLDIDKDSHLYTSSKDRTQLFEGKHDKLTLETGKALLEWLNDGRSIKDVEAEEIEKIKNEMQMSMTLDKLRNEYSIAKKKYPHMEEEFLIIANDVKEKLLESEDIKQ
jgi:hypothetical protein